MKPTRREREKIGKAIETDWRNSEIPEWWRLIAPLVLERAAKRCDGMVLGAGYAEAIRAMKERIK